MKVSDTPLFLKQAYLFYQLLHFYKKKNLNLHFFTKISKTQSTFKEGGWGSNYALAFSS